jgi:tetratricopeptide (TPR) repeat protein
MSPEQAAGQPAGFQADQFSLGAILYELATGRRAFARKTTVQTLSAILESEPPPLHEVNPSFPPPARWVVERCLAKNPADRYASTVDLAHQLRSVREHFAEASSGPSIADGALPKPRRRLRAWPIVATVLAALVVLLGLLAVPSVNDFVRERLGLLPLPAEKRVAVLPVVCRGGIEAERDACEGMFDFVIAKLGEQERFQRALSVVPAVEIRQSGVDSADAARRRLGATLAVHITAEQVGDQSLLSVSLIDTARLRQLRGSSRTFATSGVSRLDQAVDAVVEVLNLQLDEDAKSALRAGGTSVAAAATLFAQGLQATPYQTARTALEKYDQQRSLEQAIELFNRALELDRDYAHALAGLGEARLRLYQLTRQPEQIALAEGHCRRALELDNTLGQAWQTLGNLHAQTGQPEEALGDFKKALDRRPANAEIYRDIASAYDKLNRPKDAEAAFQTAFGLRPSSWSIYSYYGSFLNSKNRYVEAEAAFRQAMQMAPDNARLWSNLGGALYNQGRRGEALAAFDRSIAIHPSGIGYSNVATIRFYKGEYGAAARALEQASTLSPRDYRIWRNLGAAYYWAPGERERAAAAYSKAMELGEQERRIDATNGRLVIELADCAAMLGDKARALTLVDEALRLAPGNSQVQYMAADVYETLRDRDAALRWLGTALRAGYQRAELERSPSFERLRADPRYQKMIAALPAASSKPR